MAEILRLLGVSALLIGLVSCTKAKLSCPAAARELYSPSALFRGALGVLSGRADAVYVLSAKYGLLPLDQVVAPYDQTLKDADRADRAAWAASVFAALQRRHGASFQGITFEFHAGEAYRHPLEELLVGAGAACTCPVQGLAMGERLAFYAGRLAKPAGSEVTVAAAVPESPPGMHDLLAVMAAMQGQELTTGTGAPFRVEQVTPERVVVVPDSTKKPRPISWRELEQGWAFLLHHRMMTLGQVREVASEANPADVFALLGRMPGVRVESGRPLRLRLFE